MAAYPWGLLFDPNSLTSYFIVCQQSPHEVFAGDIHVKVFSISDFQETAGLMDKTDPFVKLTIGKVQHMTRVKNNVGGSAVFDEVSRISNPFSAGKALSP